MSFTPKTVLVCTPHPDDAEIGAGGTIAKWAKEGAKVVLVVCTNGDKGSADPEMTSARLAAIREKEQRAAAKVLGVSEVVFLNHSDSELEDNREFRGDLVREIRRHKPDVVMTTDPHRRGFYQHRDHRITGQVTMAAMGHMSRDHLSFPEHKELGLEPHKTGYVYLWGSDNADTHIDISDTLSTKIEALKRHESQIAPRRNVDFEKFMRENAERAGKENGLKVAESFRVIEMRR
ncbi:MAG: PIG-L family deacetylase [Chloroflexi bacterium]|nr:PIG-L family deacetylase [Chloroflexota bacterium]